MSRVCRELKHKEKCPQKGLHMNEHSNNICNSQKVETMHISINQLENIREL